MKHTKDKYSRCSHCGNMYDYVIMDSSEHGLIIQCSCGTITKVEDLLEDYKAHKKSNMCHWCFGGRCYLLDNKGIACSGVNVTTCDMYMPDV